MTRYKNKKSTVRADAPLVSQSTDIFRPNGFWRLQVSDDAEYRKTCAGQNLECSSIQRASESLAKKKEADECEDERRRRRRMKWEWKRGRETTGQGRPTAHARLLLLLPPHALSSSRTTKYSHDDVVYILRESFYLLSSEIFLWKKKKNLLQPRTSNSDDEVIDESSTPVSGSMEHRKQIQNETLGPGIGNNSMEEARPGHFRLALPGSHRKKKKRAQAFHSCWLGSRRARHKKKSMWNR